MQHNRKTKTHATDSGKRLKNTRKKYT